MQVRGDTLSVSATNRWINIDQLTGTWALMKNFGCSDLILFSNPKLKYIEKL